MLKPRLNKGQARIRFGTPLVGDRERTDVLDVLTRNISGTTPPLTNGGKVAAFEERFCEWIGGGQAVAVSSCTGALHLSLMALGVGVGDEVILPAQTFVACAHVIEAVGAKPVFVDVWPGSGVIDPELAEAAVTPKTKAIMPVHFAGRPAYMGTIREVARRQNVRIIEDCATALGAHHMGKHVGLIGDTGCFSFHPVKHITTGEGGMFVSTNPELAERVRRLRGFGTVPGAMNGDYDVPEVGLNYRMTEFQAAMGIHQLARAKRWLLLRALNYLKLAEALKDYEILDLECDGAAAYCLIVFVPEGVKRKRVRAQMLRNRVETSVYYPGPIPMFSYYRKKYGYKKGDFPHSERIADRTIALPVGPHLVDAQMARIAWAFKEAVE